MSAPMRVWYNGVLRRLTVLAHQHGQTPNRVRARLRLGWSLDEALTRPVEEQSKFVQAVEQYLSATHERAS